jgi:hypothetical protein
LATLLIWGPRRRVARVERPVVQEERTVYEDRPPL